LLTVKVVRPSMSASFVQEMYAALDMLFLMIAGYLNY
jgi:hypothetical protein